MKDNQLEVLDTKLLNWNDDKWQVSYDESNHELLIVDKKTGKHVRFSKTANAVEFEFIRWLLGINQYGAYMSEAQVAKYFGISIGTLRGLRKFKGLEPEKLGELKRSAVRYSMDTLIKFNDEREKERLTKQNEQNS